MQLKFTGREYRGQDEGKTIVALTGQVVEVSEAKSKQLLKDFPMHWSVPGQELKKEVKPPVAVDRETQDKVDAAVAKLRAEANPPADPAKNLSRPRAVAKPLKVVRRRK